MIRYVTLDEVIELHRLTIAFSGGSSGIRDLGGLQSAVVQPLMTFGGQELYPTLADKGSALGFSIVMNHPFVDGNKRVGHAAMEVFFVLNGFEIDADIDEQEQVILDLAAGRIGRDSFTAWIRNHLIAHKA